MATSLKDGYGISFNEWVLDNEIKNELRLLLIISSLSANKGFTNATNTYFAKLFNETEETISRKINKLLEKKYLTAEYEKTGSIIGSRKLRLTKISMAIDKNINGEKNNIDSIYNIYNNIDNKEEIKENNSNKLLLKEKKKKNCKNPPTLEEIENYILEKKYSVNPKTFYDYFNEGNWIDSEGKPVKNWKQKIITWENKNKNKTKVEFKRTIPQWFNQEIEENIENTEDDDFKDFIEDFRKKD